MWHLIKNCIKDFQRWKARHRLFSWGKYAKWVESIKRDRSPFVPFTNEPFQRQDGDIKVFAYYLPQFYPIPENDGAHGKGFTEWTNVASAIPHFVGHYQPKVPYDLGFYNLLMPGVMERQIEIANAYGVYGFCFYYYWFSGRKVLEKPLDYFLHSEIDFHYHLCWANENWSKLWDGGNKEVILQQDSNELDAERFYEDIRPFLHDHRYERIGGMPLLMIYRPLMFEQDVFLSFVKRLRELAKLDGLEGLYLTCSNHRRINPIEWGLDALTEFPPHGGMFTKCPEKRSQKRLIPSTNFKILDTTRYIWKKQFLTTQDYPVFRACFPNWDNTPRKAWSSGQCFLMNGFDFEFWLRSIIEWTKRNKDNTQQIVYINAWNEWAEGAVLEPTVREGYSKLEIIRKSIIATRNL